MPQTQRPQARGSEDGMSADKLNVLNISGLTDLHFQEDQALDLGLTRQWRVGGATFLMIRACMVLSGVRTRTGMLT